MTMRCPSCRSTTFALIETFEETETTVVEDGVIVGGRDRCPGALVHTECKCEACGHRWIPRRASLETLERA